jgi:hypothetical protein
VYKNERPRIADLLITAVTWIAEGGVLPFTVADGLFARAGWAFWSSEMWGGPERTFGTAALLPRLQAERLAATKVETKMDSTTDLLETIFMVKSRNRFSGKPHDNKK